MTAATDRTDKSDKHNKDFDAGLATRKQVMGEDFVANAFGNATDFTRPIQEHIVAARELEVETHSEFDERSKRAIATDRSGVGRRLRRALRRSRAALV